MSSRSPKTSSGVGFEPNYCAKNVKIPVKKENTLCIYCSDSDVPRKGTGDVGYWKANYIKTLLIKTTTSVPPGVT